MCLGIPMQVVAIDGFNAVCEAQGVRRTVSLFMIRDDGIEVGDHVMVHVGYALRGMTEAEARSAWDLFESVGELPS